MKIRLSPRTEALRVIGCLLEKQVTTPEQYPLIRQWRGHRLQSENEP